MVSLHMFHWSLTAEHWHIATPTPCTNTHTSSPLLRCILPFGVRILFLSSPLSCRRRRRRSARRNSVVGLLAFDALQIEERRAMTKRTVHEQKHGNPVTLCACSSKFNWKLLDFLVRRMDRSHAKRLPFHGKIAGTTNFDLIHTRTRTARPYWNRQLSAARIEQRRLYALRRTLRQFIVYFFGLYYIFLESVFPLGIGEVKFFDSILHLPLLLPKWVATKRADKWPKDDCERALWPATVDSLKIWSNDKWKWKDIEHLFSCKEK